MADILATDTRDIVSLTVSDGHEYQQGIDGVASIKPVEVCGEMAMVTWFELFHGEESEPFARINGKHVVEVYYRTSF